MRPIKAHALGHLRMNFKKFIFFRVSDHVSQLLSFIPKNFGEKELIVATLKD